MSKRRKCCTLSSTGLQFYISAEDRLTDSYKASGLTLNQLLKAEPQTLFSLHYVFFGTPTGKG